MKVANFLDNGGNYAITSGLFAYNGDSHLINPGPAIRLFLAIKMFGSRDRRGGA